MANVAVIMRVYPEEVMENFEPLINEIKQRLPREYSLQTWDEEPVAFGIKLLRILVLMPEETEGGTEKLEELISQVPGVSQVEVLIVHRVS